MEKQEVRRGSGYASIYKAPELLREVQELFAAAGTVETAEVRGISNEFCVVELRLRAPLHVVNPCSESGRGKSSPVFINRDTRTLVIGGFPKVKPEVRFHNNPKSGDERVTFTLRLGCYVQGPDQEMTLDELREGFREVANRFTSAIWLVC